jgi:DNA-binding NarL/FixJ family response regulator
VEYGADARADIEAMMARVKGQPGRGHDLVAELRRAFAHGPQACHVLARLSEREREVLEAMRRRESNKHIARRLSVSENAIKFHVKNIFRKLGVHSREAAIEAARPLS